MDKRLIEEDLVRRIKGTVKWFATSRGFGFVQHHECDDDILLHENVLKKFGRGSIAAGSVIEGFVRQTATGLQVTEILNIETPKASARHERDKINEFGAPEYQPARVKWYDQVKGFGFVNLFGDDTDYFFHKMQLEEVGLNSLSSGEAIGVVASEWERGAKVLAVQVWLSPDDF